MGVTHGNIKTIMQDSGRYHEIRGNVIFPTAVGHGNSCGNSCMGTLVVEELVEQLVKKLVGKKYAQKAAKI
jgi:hypothetical protein